MYTTITKTHPNSLTIVPQTTKEKESFNKAFDTFDKWEKQLKLHLQGKASYPRYEI